MRRTTDLFRRNSLTEPGTYASICATRPPEFNVSNWGKVRNLFWQSEDARLSAPGMDPREDDSSGSILERAERLEPEILADEFAVPPDARAPSPSTLAGARIDFQALYDQASVPNTDEVEALEKFLQGLDDTLPQVSKLTAARAFLGAIGKATDDVLNDAAAKIRVVRTVQKSKEEEAARFLLHEQEKIDAFQAQIERVRVAIEAARGSLEEVRTQCAVEETRLQAARVFFGHMAEQQGGK